MRTLLWFFLIGGASVAATPHKTAATPALRALSAFRKPVFEDYVRHLFVWPTSVGVEIGDPEPSQMPGFREVHVHASQGKASQEEVFYISNDGQKIVRGQVFDIKQNPFQADLAKIRTELRPSLGTAGASVVLVEFSDFQCHFCRDEAKLLRENLIQTFPNDVRLYFMDYPLESIHPWARAAADAGQAIHQLAPLAFWAYHDWIFENQQSITPENLPGRVAEWAKSQAIPLQQQDLLGAKGAHDAVAQTLAMGRSLGVQSTPTLFVNGRKLSGAVEWAELKRIIEYEIHYQKTAKNAGEDCGCEIRLSLPGMK